MRLLYNVNSVQNKMKLENLVGEFFTHIGMSFFLFDFTINQIAK